jgi:hypothetical protein
MKYLKMLGLAAVAAAALMALAGTGTASATVACKLTETPCAASNEWEIGTSGLATLKAGTSAVMRTTGGEAVITCNKGHVSGKLENKGGPTQTMHQPGSAANVAYEECTQTMDTIKGGEAELHHIAGTDNATVTLKGFETTVLTIGVTCTYTYGTGIDVGVITGGTKPSMDVSAVLPKSAGSFLCPTTVTGQFEGTLTEPVGAAYFEDE